MRKSTPIRFGRRLGCKGGMPHDPVTLHEDDRVKVERCRLCRTRKAWNKAYLGRTDNLNYLRFNIRKFAQRWGNTKRVWHKMYAPDQLIIHI